MYACECGQKGHFFLNFPTHWSVEIPTQRTPKSDQNQRVSIIKRTKDQLFAALRYTTGTWGDVRVWVQTKRKFLFNFSHRLKRRKYQQSAHQNPIRTKELVSRTRKSAFHRGEVLNIDGRMEHTKNTGMHGKNCKNTEGILEYLTAESMDFGAYPLCTHTHTHQKSEVRSLLELAGASTKMYKHT